MPKLVIQNAEESLAATRARRNFECALAAFAAQIMRLSAGGSDALQFHSALKSLFRALGAMESAGVRVSTEDLRVALKFEEEWHDGIGFDGIARHSLRLVAARLQQDGVQISREKSNMADAIRRRERALEEHSQTIRQRPPN